MRAIISPKTQFVRFLDWFIPSDLKDSEESLRGIRTFLMSHVVGPPIGGLVATYLVYLHSNVAAWGLAIGVLIFVTFPFLLRYTGRYDEVALASLLHFIALIFFVAFLSGGVASAALPWALTVPIVCVFFVKGFYRLIGFVALACGFAALIVPFGLGYRLPNMFESGSETMKLVLLLSATGYIVVMALAYINLYEFSIARLRWAKDEAETANRSKSEFLATMSHELRTPLNAVIGFAQMLSSQAFGPLGHSRYLEYSRDIEKSGSHLLGIINDILDIAKIEFSHLDRTLTACNPHMLAEEAIAIVTPMAAKGGIKLRCRIADDTPQLVGDERLLRQVLINLLVNGIKFSSSGGEVALGVKPDDRNEGFVRLDVQDKGCGIPKPDLERVMEPFEQIESSLSREHGGVGLGLHLSKRIVEVHGGSLELDSAPGKGTCVTVHLPSLDKAISAIQKLAPVHDGAFETAA